MKLILRTAVLLSMLSIPFTVSANEELAQKSNCLACHQVDKKILGPAYKDIAAKYDNDAATVQTLTDKVRNGGSGNWGQIPMPPNPLVSEEDAKTLVEWILAM